MRQIGLPVEDIERGDWTPYYLWDYLRRDCVAADDSTYVMSRDDPYCEIRFHDTFEVRFNPLTCPSVCDNTPKALTARLRQQGDKKAFARITALQGGSTILDQKIVEIEPWDYWIDFGLNLEGITDYTDLRLRVEACVGCCWTMDFPAPPTKLVAKFTNVSDCDDLDGKEATLTYNTQQDRWEGQLDVDCPEEITHDISLWCDHEEDYWTMEIECDERVITAEYEGQYCELFGLDAFDFLLDDDCCCGVMGEFKVKVGWET